MNLKRSGFIMPMSYESEWFAIREFLKEMQDRFKPAVDPIERYKERVNAYKADFEKLKSESKIIIDSVPHK